MLTSSGSVREWCVFYVLLCVFYVFRVFIINLTGNKKRKEKARKGSNRKRFLSEESIALIFD